MQEMDGAVVGVDHQLPARPFRIVVRTNQKFESEFFEYGLALKMAPARWMPWNFRDSVPPPAV